MSVGFNVGAEIPDLKTNIHDVTYVEKNEVFFCKYRSKLEY